MDLVSAPAHKLTRFFPLTSKRVVSSQLLVPVLFGVVYYFASFQPSIYLFFFFGIFSFILLNIFLSQSRATEKHAKIQWRSGLYFLFPSLPQGRGSSHVKVSGVIVRNFERNSLESTYSKNTAAEEHYKIHFSENRLLYYGFT